MQVIFFDFKKKIVKVQIEDIDDLWHLSHIIDIGDQVSSKTLRKIKLNTSTQESSNIKRVPITLEIKIEKIDFSKQIGKLRLLGVITQEKEDIPKGSHHTLVIEQGTKLTIQKPFWSTYHQSLLEEAKKSKGDNILILAFDREEAIFALTKKYGFDILSEIKGENQKKRFQDKKQESTFYIELIKILIEYNKRFQTRYIILASPAFFKEDLLEQIKKSDKEISNKIVLATCNSVGTNAILEIFKREEIKTVLSKTRIVLEQNLVDQLLREISKDGQVTYGITQTIYASTLNAIKILLVTDKLINDYREKGQFLQIDDIMKKTQDQKGEIHIISSENDQGKKLDSLGGIAAILKYKIT